MYALYPEERSIRRVGLGAALMVLLAISTHAQHSLVRVWNEQTLKAIRNDLARPPIHARNLFHVNAAMYDAWAAYDSKAQPWLLGRTNANYTCAFPALPIPPDVEEARKEAMSFAVYRILRHRFLNSPGYVVTYGRLDHLMDSLGYDRTFTGVDPSTGGAAALGNYIAQEYIAFGRQDGSNENGNYANQYYAPVNASLHMLLPGNPAMTDPNRWQPITLPTSIDQAGNPVSSTPGFVGAEWGNVVPFSLTDAQGATYTRDGHPWKVYLDPGPPAQLDLTNPEGLNSFFKWNHLLVSIWQSHLDATQDVIWDISPGARGNTTSYPSTPAEYNVFYDLVNGGDNSTGHALNPVTGQPYAPNLVDRGNYTRVLAEFWADGVDSETPPGHWFEILHNVMDMPDFHRRWMGQGPELDELEYDVRSHFALGSAMHDAAITAWGIKGYYDSVRPVSAVRYMCDLGQCSDPGGQRYHPAGAPIIPGLIEQVLQGDPLEGENQENLYKIKLYTYKGPDFIDDPLTDVAGVGWILAENWWTYQRPTFVTPPFAGYISGHSTYSRTAAEVLTSFTGSPYFPGGMIEYVIPQNEFLVFEDGPDEEVRLQWATYRDASDACSLSRIWGGIHPPMDDIPGREIGQQLGPQVVDLVNQLIAGGPPRVTAVNVSDEVLGPDDVGNAFLIDIHFDRSMDPASTVAFEYTGDDPTATPSLSANGYFWVSPDHLQVSADLLAGEHDLKNIDIIVTGALDEQGRSMAPLALNDAYIIDTRSPEVAEVTTERSVYARADIGEQAVRVRVTFNEEADTSTAPALTLSGLPEPSAVLELNVAASTWINEREYEAVYTLLEPAVEIDAIEVSVDGAIDVAGNTQTSHSVPAVFAVDTRSPQSSSLVSLHDVLNGDDIGSISQSITLSFDEPMDPTFEPAIGFQGNDPLLGPLSRIPALSTWIDAQTCRITYALAQAEVEYMGLDVMVEGFRDLAGNPIGSFVHEDLFSIDLRRPMITSATTSTPTIADVNVGPDALIVEVEFSEPMNTLYTPHVTTTQEAQLDGSLIYSLSGSSWISDSVFRAAFNVLDLGVEAEDLDLQVSVAKDASGNSILPGSMAGFNITVDTRNPRLVSVEPDPAMVTDAQVGLNGVSLLVRFDEPMEAGSLPAILIGDGGLGGTLILNTTLSEWTDTDSYTAVYDVQASVVELTGLDVLITEAQDEAGNRMEPGNSSDIMDIQLTGVGIEEGMHSTTVRFGPNPLRQYEMLSVVVERPLGLSQLSVVDAQGRSTYSTQVNLSYGGTHRLALPTLAAGVYQVSLDTRSGHHTARIMVVAR